jgi:hypothetical protein
MQSEYEGFHHTRLVVAADFFPNLIRQVFCHVPTVSGQIFDTTGLKTIDTNHIDRPSYFSAYRASNRAACTIFSVTLLNILQGDVERFVRHGLSSLAQTAPPTSLGVTS